MDQKEQIVKLYKKRETAQVFDKERDKYFYQKYKHKIESSFLKKSILSLDKNPVRILDVACGTGRMLQEVFSLKRNIEYWGLDTSKEMTDLLKKKASETGLNANIKLGDATKIPFEDNTFDVVYSFHLLWHIPREEQEKIISEMIRVCKKGGIILFDFLNKDFILEKLRKNKPNGEIYKMRFKHVKKILKGNKIEIEKLNDAIIKNDKLYQIFNFINQIRKIMPTKLYHMVYVTARKNV